MNDNEIKHLYLLSYILKYKTKNNVFFFSELIRNSRKNRIKKLFIENIDCVLFKLFLKFEESLMMIRKWTCCWCFVSIVKISTIPAFPHTLSGSLENCFFLNLFCKHSETCFMCLFCWWKFFGKVCDFWKVFWFCNFSLFLDS